MTSRQISDLLYRSDKKTQAGISVLSIALTFGAGALNAICNPFSFLWFITAIVIVVAGVYALRFLFACAGIVLAFIVVVWVIGYIIAYPW